MQNQTLSPFPTLPLPTGTPPGRRDKPLAVIKPRPGWSAIDLRELWQFRELLYFLTWRDVKVRYKQTILGSAWAVLQPLSAMVLFSFFFGRLAGMPSDGIPYPLFAYAGLVPWMFFANAVTSSGNSLVGNTNLITKVYFPRVIIPVAAAGSSVVDFAVAFVLLFGLMACYGFGLTCRVAWLPLLLAQTVVLAISVGTLLAAVNVRYRDVRYAMPFLIQLWMFASPVIYPASLAPGRWHCLLALNPLTGILEGCRAALFGRPFDGTAIALSAGITLGLAVAAAVVFRRMEKTFADVI